MSDGRTGSGWQPLSKPTTLQPNLAPGNLSGDKPLINRDGSLQLSPFVRLARAHALHAAGDATVAVALAGSLFFSIDPSAARSRVLLYLVCTLAPFALVGPLIGPALDRMKGGHRLVIILTLLARAGLMILMIPNIDSLWLFPIAFAQLVLGKTYSVAKAATVPTAVQNHDELVDKNSRLAVLSAAAGFVGATPAVALQKLFGSSVTLSYAFILYIVGVIFAFQMARAVVDDPEVPDDVLDIRSAGIRLAASAMSILRGVVGFLFFMLAFVLRGGTDDLDFSGVGTAAGAAVKSALGFDLNSASSEPAWKLGLPLAFWGIGILVGNLIAPKFRERFTEENMILGALTAIVGAAIAAIWAGGINGAVVLALVVGAAPSGAKLAFDSLVQRDAPGANHGTAFGRFETRFQIAWVVGAIVPVLLKIPMRLGFLVVAIASAFAAVTYYLGSRTVRTDGREPRQRRLPRRRDKPDPGGDQPAGGEIAVDATAPANHTAHAHAGADPYAEAFADRQVEPPDWAAAVFGDKPHVDPLEPPPWLDEARDPARGHTEPDATPPMGNRLDP